MTTADEKFDLLVVHENFLKSLYEEEEDIRLEDYLNSYEELNK